MAPASTNPRQHAHDLIDCMAPGQVEAVVGLLEVMLDPVARSLANAPYDDEPVSDEEAREITAARAAHPGLQGTPNQVVLAEFGLTEEEFSACTP